VEKSVAAEIQTTDKKARLCLPKAFANATVIVEQVSDTEVRIRKAQVIPEDEVVFLEEQPRTPLSDRDRDVFLALLENPPPPNEAFRRAAAEYKKRYG
jgi:hypothetical protein